MERDIERIRELSSFCFLFKILIWDWINSKHFMNSYIITVKSPYS